MKKAVKVEDIIRLAKREVTRYHLFINKGKYDIARTLEHRIQSYQSIIMILAVGDCKDFVNKWDEIYKQIWGE